MKARRVQILLLVSLLCVPLTSIFAELTVGRIYRLNFQPGDFRVFVFGRNGELLRHWNDVPTAAQLAAVVK